MVPPGGDPRRSGARLQRRWLPGGTAFLRRMSVATVTIASLVLVATLLLVGMGVFSYVTERSRQQRRLAEDLATTAEQLAIGLAKPLFNIDRTRIGLVLDLAMRDPTVAGIAV